MNETFTPADLIAELQSGRWRKAKGRLGRYSNQRCCLGVACEMAGIDASQRKGGHGFTGIPAGLVQPYRGRFEEAFPWLDEDLQSELGGGNDHNPGWDKVIERLMGIEE